MEFQRFEKGQVRENGGQLDEDGLEVDVPGGCCGGGGMRGSVVILMLTGMPGVMVCEPLYGQRLDALDKVGSLEDGAAPTPRLIRSAVLGTCQVDDLLDRDGRVEQQLCKGAEPVGYQQRLLEGEGG